MTLPWRFVDDGNEVMHACVFGTASLKLVIQQATLDSKERALVESLQADFSSIDSLAFAGTRFPYEGSFVESLNVLPPKPVQGRVEGTVGAVMFQLECKLQSSSYGNVSCLRFEFFRARFTRTWELVESWP